MYIVIAGLIKLIWSIHIIRVRLILIDCVLKTYKRYKEKRPKTQQKILLTGKRFSESIW